MMWTRQIRARNMCAYGCTHDTMNMCTRTRAQRNDKGHNMRMNTEQIVGLAGMTLMTLSLPLSALSLFTTPEPPSDDVAMIHDVQEGTFIVYPDSLPPCDNEDGTSSVNSLPVSACAWDDGTGRAFIVLSPSLQP